MNTFDVQELIICYRFKDENKSRKYGSIVFTAKSWYKKYVNIKPSSK